MGDIEIIDNLPKWLEANTNALDRALNRMAIDIERLSKAQVPVGPTKKQNKSSSSSGQLRASGHHKKVGFLEYHTIYNKVYAAYQEYGSWPDGSHKIRNHTKPGSKTFYLRDAGRTISRAALDYIKQEVERITI